MTTPSPYGRVVAGYRIVGRLRQGPDATVYHAVREANDQAVALKVLRTDAHVDDELSRIAALPEHPNIVSVVDHGHTNDGRPYLAMQYWPDGSYADLLGDTGPIAVDEAVRVGIAVAVALGVTHDAGLVHRDVTPGNILRGPDGPGLTDFGIAANPRELAGTVALDRLTPPHAAPEALSRNPQDARSDVYSLASTLWTLLAGHPPFAEAGELSPDPFEYRERALHSAVPAIPRDDVPSWLQGTLARAMAKNPDDRYPDAATFAEALRTRDEPSPTFPVQPAALAPIPTPTTPMPVPQPPAAVPMPALPPRTEHVPMPVLPATTAHVPMPALPPQTEHVPMPGLSPTPQVPRPGVPIPVSGPGAAFRSVPLPSAQPRPAAGPSLAGPAQPATAGVQPVSAVPQPGPSGPTPVGLPPAPLPPLPAYRESESVRDDDPGPGWWTADDVVPMASPDPVFGEEDRDRGRPRRRVLASGVAVAVVATVGLLAFLLAPVVRDSFRGAAPMPTTAPAVTATPTAVAGLAPENIRLDDERIAVTLTWRDTTNGEAVFYVVGTPAGGSPATVANAARGKTTVRVNGLNPTVNYCFVLVAALSVDEVANSDEICTNRFSTGTPPVSPTPSG